MTSRLMRIGAVAAIVGVLMTILATVTEVLVSSDATEAMNEIAASGFFTLNRYIDVLGTLLILAALAIVGLTLHSTEGRDWSRLGQILLGAGVACGLIAITFGIAVHQVAEAGVAAEAALQPGYIAAVDALGYVVASAFAAAFIAIGLYLVTLGAAILVSKEYPRWIGMMATASGGLMFVGVPGALFISGGFFLLTMLGFVFWLVITVALGFQLWQRAGRMSVAVTPVTPPAAAPAS